MANKKENMIEEFQGENASVESNVENVAIENEIDGANEEFLEFVDSTEDEEDSVSNEPKTEDVFYDTDRRVVLTEGKSTKTGRPWYGMHFTFKRNVPLKNGVVIPMECLVRLKPKTKEKYTPEGLKNNIRIIFASGDVYLQIKHSTYEIDGKRGDSWNGYISAEDALGINYELVLIPDTDGDKAVFDQFLQILEKKNEIVGYKVH